MQSKHLRVNFRFLLAIFICLCVHSTVNSQNSFVDFRMGVADFHFKDVLQEIQNGATVQQATYKQFSNTPNLGGDGAWRFPGGFTLLAGGNYGNTGIVNNSQNIEMKSLVNNVITDTAKVNGIERYGRLKFGLGFCGDPKSSVFAGVNISGEYGWGSSLYFSQLFSAYDPLTGYIDPSKIQIVGTSWVGAYANLFINFRVTEPNAPVSQFLGLSMTFPRVWRNGELQKALTPGLFVQYGFVLK